MNVLDVLCVLDPEGIGSDELAITPKGTADSPQADDTNGWTVCAGPLQVASHAQWFPLGAYPQFTSAALVQGEPRLHSGFRGRVKDLLQRSRECP